jgi:ATP-dependent DNA helicase RecG
MEIADLKLVKTGPSLGERLERKIAATHHSAVVSRLRKLRERLEADMMPEPLAALVVSAVVLLAEVCDSLGLSEDEKAEVLGPEGMVALAWELAVGNLNARQTEALNIARRHGSVTLSTFRAVCPKWSDETLRLDLADLVERGLLVKNGDKRGTRYTLSQ